MNKLISSIYSQRENFKVLFKRCSFFEKAKASLNFLKCLPLRLNVVIEGLKANFTIFIKTLCATHKKDTKQTQY